MPFAGQPNPCSLNSKMCISVSSNLLPFNDSKSGLCIYIFFQDLNYSKSESCSAFLRGSRSKTPSAG